MMRAILYQLHTLFLFTASDFKTIVIPSTLFGIVGCYVPLAQEQQPSTLLVLRRAPLVLLWTWINLLPFAISNQRHTQAIQEDGLNKPWRPLPSQRLTQARAKTLMLASYVTAYVFSLLTNGTKSCLALISPGWWYNEKNGAESCAIRNFINAAGYIGFVYGAVEVAVGPGAKMTVVAIHWFLLIGLIIFSTVQIQDIQDQVGDKARGRSTLPLLIGDQPARWSVVFLLPSWWLIAPSFWRTGLAGYILPLFLSMLIALRMLCLTNRADDKVSFRLWNVWVIAIYITPLLAEMRLLSYFV